MVEVKDKVWKTKKQLRELLIGMLEEQMRIPVSSCGLPSSSNMAIWHGRVIRKKLSRQRKELLILNIPQDPSLTKVYSFVMDFVVS